jgi:hypothetical protein
VAACVGGILQSLLGSRGEDSVRRLGLKALCDLFARPEKPSCDRCLTHPQRAASLSIRESEYVHRHEREPEVLGKSRDRLEYLLHLERVLGLSHWPGISHDGILELGDGDRPARCGTPTREEGIAQDPHQVVELLAPAKHPRAREGAGQSVQVELLGVLARPAQCPGGAVKAINVLVKAFGIECAHGNQRSHSEVRERATMGF